MNRIVKPHKVSFWSLVLGMAMLVLMLPLRPYSSLSVRALTGCVAPPAGMVSWWSGDGHANDIQGANHGTLKNGTTFAPGKVAQAFSFDGADDYVAASDNVIINESTGFTIDFWFNATGLPSNYNLYVDGGLVALETHGGIGGSNNTNEIGRDGPAGGGSGFVKGLVDEVEVFDRALSQSEIQAIALLREDHPRSTAPARGAKTAA